MILPKKSKLITAWFAGLGRGKLKKSFHRLSFTARSEMPRFESKVPALVVANHPSWWDALLAGELSCGIFKREYFGMFDAEQLRRYGIFRYVGGYAAEKAEGAAAPDPAEMKRFLRYTRDLLEGRDRLLWIFAQGDLVSPEEPLRLKRGFEAVARQLTRVQLLKINFSYDYWLESKPEIVVDVLPLETLADPRAAAGSDLADRVEREMEDARLYVRSIVRSRDRSRLRTVWEAPAGANPFYDAYRSATAFFSGKKFDRSHAA